MRPSRRPARRTPDQPRRAARPASPRRGLRSRSAAAASCGAAARTLRRSPSPALMPPSNGSTSRSNTASPSCGRTSARRLDTSSSASERLRRRVDVHRLGHDARRAERREVGRHAEHEPVRQASERAVPPHVGGGCRGRHQRRVDAELAAQVEAPRHTGEERVGAFVDRPAGERRRGDLAARAGQTPRGRRSSRRAAGAAARTRRRGRRCRRRRRRPVSCRQRSHFGQPAR